MLEKAAVLRARDLLTTRVLDKERIASLFDKALECRRRRLGGYPLYTSQTSVGICTDLYQLGSDDVFVLAATKLGLSWNKPGSVEDIKAISFEDLIRVYRRLVDVMVVRHRDLTAQALACMPHCPVISIGGGGEQPVAGLSNLFALYEARQGEVGSLAIACVGDCRGNEALTSFLYALANFCSPDSVRFFFPVHYEPDEQMIAYLESRGISCALSSEACVPGMLGNTDVVCYSSVPYRSETPREHELKHGSYRFSPECLEAMRTDAIMFHSQVPPVRQTGDRFSLPLSENHIDIAMALLCQTV